MSSPRSRAADGAVAPYVGAKKRPSARFEYDESERVRAYERGLFRRAVMHYQSVEPETREMSFASSRLINAQYAASALRTIYGARSVEYVGVVSLSVHYVPHGHCILGQGTDRQCEMCFPEMLRFLALSCASAFLLFHNHPSGDLEWSPQDVDITRKAIEVGRLLGVPCVDHVLFTEHSHLSMRETFVHGRMFDAP